MSSVFAVAVVNEAAATGESENEVPVMLGWVCAAGDGPSLFERRNADVTNPPASGGKTSAAAPMTTGFRIIA